MAARIFAVSALGVAAQQGGAATQDPVCPPSYEAELANCQTQAGDIYQQLEQTKQQLEITEAKLEAALLEASAATGGDGHLTWVVATSWLQNTFDIQKAILSKAYGTVVKPSHEELLSNKVSEAKSLSLGAFAKAQAKAEELYNQHLKKHYDQHAAAHVNKAMGVLSEHFENAQNLYKLHAEEKVEAQKKVLSGHASNFYKNAVDGLNFVPLKVHDAVAPKIDALIAHFPEQQSNIPDALHDRLLLFTAIIGLFVMYTIVGAKVFGFAFCTTKKIVGFAFGVVMWFVLFPFRLLTCQFCRKRSTVSTKGGKGKQSFSKPPAANGSNGTSKNAVSGKKKR